MKSHQTIKTAIKFFGAAFLCAAFFNSSVSAQFDSATLLGTVRDSAEAVVPSATVTAENTETGNVVTVMTDAEGNYQFLNVKIGTYAVTAEAEEFATPFSGRRVRYVASDERTCTDTARVLGAAIEKPDLQWVRVSDEQARGGLEAIGMNPRIAAEMVEMYAGFHSGLLSEDYNRHKPEVMGKAKLEDFAVEFAVVFAQ